MLNACIWASILGWVWAFNRGFAFGWFHAFEIPLCLGGLFRLARERVAVNITCTGPTICDLLIRALYVAFGGVSILRFNLHDLIADRFARGSSWRLDPHHRRGPWGTSLTRSQLHPRPPHLVRS